MEGFYGAIVVCVTNISPLQSWFTVRGVVLSQPLWCRSPIAAVLPPQATALVWGSDTADTVAFVSHFPRAQ